MFLLDLLEEDLYKYSFFCRKILNDLSSDAPGVPRIEEEKSEEETTAPAITTVTVPTPIYQTSSGQYSMWFVFFHLVKIGEGGGVAFQALK